MVFVHGMPGQQLNNGEIIIIKHLYGKIRWSADGPTALRKWVCICAKVCRLRLSKCAPQPRLRQLPSLRHFFNDNRHAHAQITNWSVCGFEIRPVLGSLRNGRQHHPQPRNAMHHKVPPVLPSSLGDGPHGSPDLDPRTGTPVRLGCHSRCIEGRVGMNATCCYLGNCSRATWWR